VIINKPELLPQNSNKSIFDNSSIYQDIENDEVLEHNSLSSSSDSYANDVV